jgi:hypothetical protein
VKYTFFGVQILVQAFHGDPLRRKLHDVIAKGGEEQTLNEKRRFWKRLVGVFNEAMPVFEMGYWDLVRGSKAEETFETWSSELEGALATEKEETGAAADEVIRLSAHKKHILVTFMVLVAADSNSDATLGERCALPESQWWTRRTLARLVETFSMLNFASVQADAVYLSPGNDRDGLSMEDIHGGGYEHLKPLD